MRFFFDLEPVSSSSGTMNGRPSKWFGNEIRVPTIAIAACRSFALPVVTVKSAFYPKRGERGVGGVSDEGERKHMHAGREGFLREKRDGEPGAEAAG